MKKILKYIERIMNGFEIVIAIFLLVVIAIRLAEVGAEVFDYRIVVLNMEFNSILSIALALVIGVEFTKMLCKHTPESVIDVLLFTIARHLVLYNDHALELLVGVVAISGLFAAKKFLLDKNPPD